MKGHFELEVFSSEAVLLTQLPESSSRMIAGEWTEATAGGCHLNPLTFKKNPKFVLKLKKFGQGRRSSVNNSERGSMDRQAASASEEKERDPSEPMRTRITVSRVGSNWKGLIKKDTVGCLIGFYLFIRRVVPITPPPPNPNAPPINNATPVIQTQTHELTQIYESVFVPDHEARTEEDFTLGMYMYGCRLLLPFPMLIFKYSLDS